MWPDDQILSVSPKELERLYAHLPNITEAALGIGSVSGVSYLEHLLETRRALRSWLGTAAYRDLVESGGRSHDTFVRYDPFANTVSVVVGVLEEPHFYALGTKAINYGGLVAAFARKLVSIIDVDDVRFYAK
ncbi:hypothetical protein V5799_027354 [Amblyomma americanum]|uniref:Uncharacterized protein n=1 Tax=Amblyomma americanum TaxID=6943 RepID=A0AAQ4DFY9_AMBAM